MDISPIGDTRMLWPIKRDKKYSMKCILLVIVSIFLIQSLFAQKKDIDLSQIPISDSISYNRNVIDYILSQIPISDSIPYNGNMIDYIETSPEFPGGIDSLMCFIESNLNFKILNERHKRGRVIVYFIIESSGKVSNVETNKFDRDDLLHDSLIIDELKRVIMLLPDWSPCRLNDKPVRCRYTMQFAIPYTDLKCRKNM